MKLSYVHRLLLAADPFTALGVNFRSWRQRKPPVDDGKQTEPARHLTFKQRDDISTSLQETVTGPVSMSATTSDKEAVSYQGEIANVLEETGFDVKIDNRKIGSLEEKIPAGVEMTVSDKTVRPPHAYWIVQAFRRAGIAIATRIRANKLRKNNTLYISVGPNAETPSLSLTAKIAANWQSNVRVSLRAKWKRKFGFTSKPY